jgi:hypothetical protein
VFQTQFNDDLESDEDEKGGMKRGRGFGEFTEADSLFKGGIKCDFHFLVKNNAGGPDGSDPRTDGFIIRMLLFLAFEGKGRK